MTTITQKIPSGYKQTEIGVIPADWDVKTFKDICWVNQGLQIAIEKRLKNPTAKSKKYITIQYLNDGKETEYIDDYSLSVCCVKDDILMTRTGNTGIVISGVEGVFHNNFFKINFDKKQIEKDYFLYYLKDSKTKRIILEKAGTSTIPDLNHNDFYSIQIPLPPSKTERTAIATALSDADALITKTKKLIQKKKNIKQGAMQQLLTGKKRLPGFSGKWETKRLGDVCDINKGQLITDSTRIDGLIPVIAGGKTPAYYHSKANRHGKTITISCSGASAGYIAFYTRPIFASDCSTIEESKNYSIEYIYFLLQTLQQKIYKMQTGGAQPHIHPSDLNPITVLIPRPEEQTAIAIILSDMDTELEKLESQLTKYQNIKQGMMQTLLTGKIRLKHDDK